MPRGTPGRGWKRGVGKASDEEADDAGGGDAPDELFARRRGRGSSSRTSSTTNPDAVGDAARGGAAIARRFKWPSDCLG